METRKAEIEDFKPVITRPSVAQLREQRNDGTDLPAYPSAQLWRNYSEAEKLALEVEVDRTGKDWGEYNAEMRKHWPMDKTNMIKHKVVRQK